MLGFELLQDGATLRRAKMSLEAAAREAVDGGGGGPVIMFVAPDL